MDTFPFTQAIASASVSKVSVSRHTLVVPSAIMVKVVLVVWKVMELPFVWALSLPMAALALGSSTPGSS
jgi:hypothetical protein